MTVTKINYIKCVTQDVENATAKIVFVRIRTYIPPKSESIYVDA